ncbi:MAG: DUF4012 domain-containing protein [Sporichthyaceae bacterium]
MARRVSGRAIACAALIGGLGACAWFALDAYGTGNDLKAAKAAASTLRTQVEAGDLDAARVTAVQLTDDLRQARERTSGPMWAIAARIPVVDDTVRTVRGVSWSLDTMATTALPELLTAAADVRNATHRDDEGRVDLAAVGALGPALTTSGAALDRAVAEIAALPANTLFGEVDAGRADLLTELTAAAQRVHVARSAVQVLPAMLGAEGKRTYLLAYQNNAEARGTGGLAGAFGTLEVHRGRIALGVPRPERVLIGATATSLDLGAEYEHAYEGARTKTQYVNANLSPHFPYAARIWSTMWQQRFGTQVDGVIALDPAVLGYLLAVSGPARLLDGTEVGAHNVVALTQQEAYARFPRLSDDAARRRMLGEIQLAVGHRITSPTVDARGLVSAAARGMAERRLLVWSARESEQRILEQFAVAGAIPTTEAPYVGLSIVNEAGNKLDYYLERALTWRRIGCGPRREVEVTVQLRNAAPAGLSEFVTARHDSPGYPVASGDHRVVVSYLATAGATLQSATLDGQRTLSTWGRERGHPLIGVDVELPRGRARTLVLKLSEPDGGGAAPVVLHQPLVRPLGVHLDDEPCKESS